MGSGLDDWIYWHMFTITIDYGSSHSMTVYGSLHSLLDYELSFSTVTNVKSLLIHWTPTECRIKKIHESIPFYNCERIE
jgi:hypothetical protein